MSIEVKIPAVGESIVSGLLSTWHKKEGETVAAGDALFTLETDKVSSEVVAEQSGVLHIKVPEGTEVKIGEVVASIDPSGASSAAVPPPPAPAPPAPQPAAAAPAAPPAPKVPKAPAAPPPASDPARAAREVSAEMFVGPSTLAAEGAASAERRSTRRKLSPIRRKIAAQLVMAQQNAAILTTFNEVDMSGVMSLRKRLQESFVKQHGIKLGFMSFFIKATVRALKEIPSINGRMDGEDFIQNHYFDIGVAVGTERGLVVPVVRDADAKSFARLESDLAEFAARAREGKLKVEELQGGVFTISNGGVYGSLLSTPILNPPQSGILGMHKIQERPVALDGQVVIRPMMYLALSYDHRVVDGKEAVTFLVRVKECLEDPARLLIEA